jgi:hypothetical protein
MRRGVAYGGSVTALPSPADVPLRAALAHPAGGSHCLQSFDSSIVETFGGSNGAAVGEHDTAVAKKVVRAFNTWAFKREQPSNPQLMLQITAEAVAAQAPVPFVLYWGKGPRREPAEPESECLDFLAALTARVRNAYAPGAALTLILTDTHAELNGHLREDIQHYFDALKPLAAQRGFATTWLGPLIKAAGPPSTAAPLEEAVSADLLTALTESAEKWYRGVGAPADGALSYLRMNLIEQRVVERAFPRSIFVTFNGSSLRSLFPRQLPIFYMYSLRRGVAIKPWFLPAVSMNAKPNAGRKHPVNAGAA